MAKRYVVDLDEGEMVELVVLTPKSRPIIVANEIGAWEFERNAARVVFDWRFTIPIAKDKLKKLYPMREE